MSDIVRRLRLSNGVMLDAEREECADEIERLRADLDDQKKDTVCDEQRVADLMADVQRLGAENERLRGLLRETQGVADPSWWLRVRDALGDT